MASRAFSLSAVLCLLISAAGCTAPVPKPPESEKPKTTAELLVGTWKMVKLQNKSLKPNGEILINFTDNGKFTWRINSQKRGMEIKNGTYNLHDNVIRFTSVPEAYGPDEGQPLTSWDVTIESITADELSTSTSPSRKQQTHVYKKVLYK